ncbi:hypothetical protein [Acinetobacter proteolyticus]|uniref:Uncharacterized protein n=1 Tax=Acinetobacter proteolyticus TaxID=1776741 RepID=A0A2N0WF99_9GAMM|nr:hypothetical protein [Acinetobacter proteolyticus]PKF33543.1 hypothetical protein CW311_11430 [Acinetobacter proteolyticus]
MELIDDSISFLSGFLNGLAEIDGDIREKHLNIFTVDHDSLLSIESNFFKHYDNYVGRDFTYEKINFSKIETLIQDYLLTKPLGMTIDTTDRKKYLAFRIMDYLSWCFSDDVDVYDLAVYFAMLTLPSGVLVRYLIIPFNNKALYFLIQEKVTLE